MKYHFTRQAVSVMLEWASQNTTEKQRKFYSLLIEKIKKSTNEKWEVITTGIVNNLISKV